MFQSEYIREEPLEGAAASASPSHTPRLAGSDGIAAAAGRLSEKSSSNPYGDAEALSGATGPALPC